MAKIKYRRYYFYYLLRVAIFIARMLPLKAGQAAAGFLGKVGFAILPKYRRLAVENLETALGVERSRAERIASNVFSNLAKNGAEWIKLSALNPSDLGKIVTEDEGFENLDEAFKTGKGVIVLAFHFGNWELTGVYLRYKGYPGALVARRIYFYKYDKLITGLRARYDARVIYRDESPKKMLKVLKENSVLGIVPDQDVDSVDGVFVNFLGRPAFTPTAPVKIAMASGAKIVPVFVVRKNDGTHKVIVDRPIDVIKGSKDGEDVKKYTQAWSDVLERYVREYPDQWVWVHARWKTQEGTEDASGRVLTGTRS